MSTTLTKTQISINNLKIIEKNKVLRLLYTLTDSNQVDKISDTTFKDKFTSLSFQPTFAYKVSDVKSLTTTNFFAFKIYTYITIGKNGSGIYNVSTLAVNDGHMKVYLNNFLILDTNVNRNNKIYLNPGTYLLYVERTHNKSNSIFNTDSNPLNNITLTLTTKQETDNLDIYITRNFDLFSDAITSRDNATITYCNKNDAANKKNFFSTDNTNICKLSRESNSLLNNTINDFCFPSTKNANSLINSDCKTLFTSTSLNTGIKNNGYNKYDTWAASIKDTIGSNKDALEEYISWRNPSSINYTIPDQLINYCQTEVKDFEVPSSNKLCNAIYNNSNSNFLTGDNKTKIDASKKEIKINYCATIENGKPRYETDTKCNTLLTEDKISNLIKTRCISNDIFNKDDPYCIQLSDSNINNTTDDPYKSINNKRIELLKSEIQKISPSSKISDQSLKFAIGKYKEKIAKSLNDELLRNELYNYCEENERNYPTIPDSQCKTIYNAYSNEPGVKDSKSKMTELLCKLPENNNTMNTDESKTNALNCKDLIFNTNDINLVENADIVKEYCSKDNNIINSECQTYYTDIETKLFKTTQPYNQGSPFENKESFSNNDQDLDYTGFYVFLGVVLFIVFMTFVLNISTKSMYKKKENESNTEIKSVDKSNIEN
jgi:hypothetical protein